MVCSSFFFRILGIGAALENVHQTGVSSGSAIIKTGVGTPQHLVDVTIPKGQ